MSEMIVPSPVADALLAQCLGRPRAYDELKRLCDTVGGRTSGLESGRLAEEWGFGLFERWGVDAAWFEEFSLVAWRRGTLVAEALSPAPWRLTAMAHGNAPEHGRAEAVVVDVGHGEREQFENAGGRVRGAIVLCDEGSSEGKRRLHRTEKLKLAVEFGAVGLMILSSAPGGLTRTGVCHEAGSPIPSIGISQEDGERLRRLLADGLHPIVRIEMENLRVPASARNVLAEIRGTEAPDEVVLAGAHLDSWDVAQGATDNGLGAAIVLQMALALASLPARPRCTVRFALWAAEEVGLCGAWDYVRRHEDELPRHRALMNFDMTGDPYGFSAPRPKGTPAPEALVRLAEQLAPLGMQSECGSGAYLHSDHQPFMLSGVPVLSLAATLPNDAGRYYHSVGDTFDKVSLPALCRAAAVGAHTLWALADAPVAPLERHDAAAVRRMIDEANLYEALVAEGYSGPPMQVGEESAGT